MKSLTRFAAALLVAFAALGCKEEAKSTPVNSPAVAPVNPQDKADEEAQKKAKELNKSAK